MVAEDQPLQGKIHMIIGGSSGSVEPYAAKRPWLEEPIIFTKQDAEGVQTPHNDAVVTSYNSIAHGSADQGSPTLSRYIGMGCKWAL